jgi:Uma2 family endonuclease
MGAHAYQEHYTYKDYQIWEGDWELIYGQPIAMAPSPMITHQAIANLIAFELTHAMQECEKCLVLGEEDWKISDDTVVRPDVVMICNEPHDAYITKRPEIVVEVTSKSTIKRDESIKYELYQDEKVPYYIIVYPNDLKARIYKLIDGKFESQGSFLDEVYHLDNVHCEAKIDFNRVFKRFRK